MEDTYIDPYAGVESGEEQQLIYRRLLEDYEQKRGKVDEYLRQEWSEYRKVQVEQDTLFNRHIFTVTAGLFGVSFAFIDKLVPFTTAVYKLVMICGWTLFAATLVLTLACHLVSSFVHTGYCKDVNENIQRNLDGEQCIQQRHWYQGWLLDTLYIMSFLGFLGGVVCLILFVLLNV